MNVERLLGNIRTIYESQKQDSWIYSPNLYIYGKLVSADIIEQDINNLREVTYIEEKNQLIEDYKQVGIEIKAFKFKKKAEYKSKEKDDVYIGYQVFMNDEQPIFDISERSKLMSHTAKLDSLYLRGVKIIDEDKGKTSYIYNFAEVADTLEIKYCTFEMEEMNNTFADIEPKVLTIDNCEIHVEEMQYAFANCGATYMNITNNKFVGSGKIYGMFISCQNLKELDLTNNKFPAIYDTANIFRDCITLREIKGLDCFDMTYCENANRAFCNCKSLETIDISSWEFKKLKFAGNIFENAVSLHDLNLGKIELSDALDVQNIFKDTNTQVKIQMKDKMDLLNLKSTSASICIAPIKIMTSEDYTQSHLRMLYKQFKLKDMQDTEKYESVVKVIRAFEDYISTNLINRKIKLDNDYYKLILNYDRSHSLFGEAFELDYQAYKEDDETFIKNYTIKKAIFDSSEVIFDIGVCYLVYSLEREKPLIYIREQ